MANTSFFEQHVAFLQKLARQFHDGLAIRFAAAGPMVAVGFATEQSGESGRRGLGGCILNALSGPVM